MKKVLCALLIYRRFFPYIFIYFHYSFIEKKKVIIYIW